ncbi:hypothetical protein [Halostagnicola kamekurae]|uniref:Uncharacterized protein n=1 Tax=Halostagnicola kamekurae TaxID=619731 RepID=A0A1I6V5J5_9EURY|nr:hypothetical protein [Halostagnicola kamekurae]SFT08925.1 hypothetical protein SAMN04488556_0064 [Halostagnicola kamekurae]
MVQTDPYQLLQVIGLSLPFLALYLTVLVEIHKLPKPIQVSSSDHRFRPVSVHALTDQDDKEWAGTVTLSYAYQHWDFVFALASIILILFSAITMIISLVVKGGNVKNIAFILLTASYGAAAISAVYTLKFCYKNFSPSND